MTPTEGYMSRYNRVEREADSLGRIIGVRRLRPSQQTKLVELTPALEGDSEMTVLDEKTGLEKTIGVSRRLQLTLAAAVCEVDGNPYPFVRTRGELDAVYDTLDREGIEAAMIAYARLFPTQAQGEEAGDAISEAKK
jgi:hypothetical protein